MSHKYGKKLLKIELELVAQTNAMLAFWDKDLICRYANNAYREWFGKSPEEMIDKMRLDDLLGPLYEKNRPYIERVLRGETQVFEREIPTPSGVVRSSIATYRPYFRKGKVEGFFVHVADITPIKKNFNTSSSEAGNENVLLLDEMEKVVKTLQANIFCAFPGINQLARLHHISPSKLKRDFCNRFRKGIFSYFRQMQMEFAYNYFKRNRCSKKEMAAMLNFSNPSNFSVCYNNYLRERKVEERIENILKENDERYKTFIAQSPFPIAMLDKESRFLAASQKWFDFFRSSECEQIGHYLHEVFPTDDYWNGIYSRALAGEMLSKDEDWLVFADRKICIKWDVRPWYLKPDIIGGLLFYLEDITEAKLSATEALTLQ